MMNYIIDSNFMDLKPNFILSEKAELAAQKQAEWMDTIIFSNISGWKGDLLLKFPNRYLARILGIKVEVEYRRLDVGNFGNEITITLNGKVIGKRKFIWTIKK